MLCPDRVNINFDYCHSLISKLSCRKQCSLPNFFWFVLHVEVWVQLWLRSNVNGCGEEVDETRLTSLCLQQELKDLETVLRYAKVSKQNRQIYCNLFTATPSTSYMHKSLRSPSSPVRCYISDILRPVSLLSQKHLLNSPYWSLICCSLPVKILWSLLLLLRQ